MNTRNCKRRTQDENRSTHPQSLFLVSGKSVIPSLYVSTKNPNPLPAVHGATRFFGMLRQICLIKNYINYGPGLIKIQIQSFLFISNLRKRETFCQLLLLGDTSEIRPLQTANPLLTARS